MTIEEVKQFMKAHKITYDELARRTGLSKSCITKIFAGYAQFPRMDTWQAIEKALGLTPELPTMSPQEQELAELIMQLTPEEVAELTNYVDFILSKRK